MIIRYSEVVNLCHFAYKGIPKDTSRQKVVKYRIELDPSVQTNVGTDSFGNIKLYGTIKKPHLFLEYHIAGEISINQVLYEEEVKEERLGMYRYPYGKVKPGDVIKAYYQEIKESELWADAKTDYERAILIMQCIHRDFEYKKNVTNNETTALLY